MVTVHAMWCSPFYVLAVLALLWFEVGWATFVGLGVLLALVPLTGGWWGTLVVPHPSGATPF